MWPFSSISTLPMQGTLPPTNIRGKKHGEEKFVGFTSILFSILNFPISEHEKENGLGIKPEFEYWLCHWPAVCLWAGELTSLREWKRTCEQRRWWRPLGRVRDNIVKVAAQPMWGSPYVLVSPPSISDPVTSLRDEHTSLSACLLGWVLNSHGLTDPGDCPCLHLADSVTSVQP